ncbi:hypothetical protein NC653_009079 [Populus alba x Populus x berolinensis]|uniref:Uncharacterized protein n=1 Tax=Populus alba x Populus x berolinensis TaxID=444605 RepID=A0AAD6W989_9ROSI|nr:hypothetical protein NC653_009079 [Populus alba x Populus x berolinensis]
MQCFGDAVGRLQESVQNCVILNLSFCMRNINSRQRTRSKCSLMMIKKGGKVRVTNFRSV